ncbi:MAG: RtcB family protein, partial [Candidatus Odinarchaeia archaeon]
MSVNKIPMVKVDKNIWKIPKNYKSCMNVPGILYADEELLTKIKTDLTLEQLANIACLPGVLKYSIAMPDAHQGYGFPIGGVAATDYDSGVISPGGVGYDINCLSPNSKILTDAGYWIKISDLPNQFKNKRIKIYNISKGHNDSSQITFIFRRKIEDNESPIRVLTEGGREIEGSGKHQVLTKNGYKSLRELTKDDLIAIYPFEGNNYEEKNECILDENNFKECDKQIIDYLKERKLIPLNTNNPNIHIIA